MAKWTFWFEQINADVVHDIEADNYEEAVKQAWRIWRESNLPAEIKYHERLDDY